MRVFYDCEFLDDGSHVFLLSIGMVRDDGQEYYAVIEDAPWELVRRHRWLCENVVPHLPLAQVGTHPPENKIIKAPVHGPDFYTFVIDKSSALVRPRWVVANEVRDFIVGAHPDQLPHVALWAWYSAYDHVALCQLWGPMSSLPEGIPMWTNDLKQLAQLAGNPALPKLPGAAEHNALDDAREVKYRYGWLREHYEFVAELAEA